MRTIGLIGGMSWESSAVYYRIVNQAVRERVGPGASARCILWSFDFAQIERLQHAGDWAALEALMVDAARRLEAAGADLIVICTNTMHRMADAVLAVIGVPLLHIADAAALAVRSAGLTRVGLLGTAFTMEQPFYADRLARHGLDVIVPDADDRALVHRVIYDELIAGRIEPASRAAYRGVIARLVDRGAEAVVLGCTEIMLLIGPDDAAVPVFDTTAIHAEAAVTAALA